jgi:hypothetical protein
MLLSEILSTPKDLKQTRKTDKVREWRLMVDHHPIEFTAAQWEPHKWIFYFRDEDDDTWNLTGKGGEFKVFGAAKQILDELVKDGAKQINFDGRKEDSGADKRIQLYRKFLKKYTPPGFSVEESYAGDDKSVVYFKLTKD